jgi:hypothetical protein
MPDSWERPFGYAHLKIERANKHIADIEQRLSASSDSYGPSLHIDRKTGEQFLYYVFLDRTLRPDIALMVGDAIHNLHCALDFAWQDTVRRLSPEGFRPTKTKFPVTDTREKLVSDLTVTARISSASRLFDFMVEDVKPYGGGDGDILALHALDIDDKHHLLIPMLTVTGVMGVELENVDGTRMLTDILIVPPDRAFRQAVQLGAKLADHGKVTFYITFRQGTYLQGQEIVPALLRMSAKVLRIIRRLQRMN